MERKFVNQYLKTYKQSSCVCLTRSIKFLQEEMIESKKAKIRNAKKKAKWDFKSCPCEQFNKTLDDTFMVFVKWAKVKESQDQYNVSKVSIALLIYVLFFEISLLAKAAINICTIKQKIDILTYLLNMYFEFLGIRVSRQSKKIL